MSVISFDFCGWILRKGKKGRSTKKVPRDTPGHINPVQSRFFLILLVEYSVRGELIK